MCLVLRCDHMVCVCRILVAPHFTSHHYDAQGALVVEKVRDQSNGVLRINDN